MRKYLAMKQRKRMSMQHPRLIDRWNFMKSLVRTLLLVGFE